MKEYAVTIVSKLSKEIVNVRRDESSNIGRTDWLLLHEEATRRDHNAPKATIMVIHGSRNCDHASPMRWISSAENPTFI